MRTTALLFVCLLFCLASCTGSSSSSQGSFLLGAGKPDAFNPWHNAKLPSSLHLSRDGMNIVGSMGGQAQSLQSEASHRPHWREEVYPIVFGSRDAPHEVIALIDFADPKSEKLWDAVLGASRSLDPNAVKIVVLGKSRELYGTELMGMMIWIVQNRKGQAMPYLQYALHRWNEVKAEQKRQGRVRPFVNEYDSTAHSSDFPIHYNYISRLRPPVPEEQELAIVRYSYDAGNVNAYQASQVSSYYGAKSIPCIIVDGTPLSEVTNASLLAQLQK